MTPISANISNTLESIYTALKERAGGYLVNAQINPALALLSLASGLAYGTVFRVFHDDDYEDTCRKIGQHLESKQSHINVPRLRKDVLLHVIPFGFNSGGLLAFTENLRALAPFYRQLVLAPSSFPNDQDPSLEAIVASAGGNLLECPHGLGQSSLIRLMGIIAESAPALILDYTSSAPLTSIALEWASHTLGIPLIRFNYTDHRPITGRLRATLWLEYRESGVEIARRLRFVSTPGLLRLPAPQRGPIESLDRSDLGINPQHSVSITCAPYLKIRPIPGFSSYLFLIEELLRKESKHSHILICPDFPKRTAEKLRSKWKNRFLILGYVKKLHNLLQCADFAIESFPVLGNLTRIEYIQNGLPVLARRNALFSLFSDSDELPSNYSFLSRNDVEWEKLARILVEDKASRDSALIELEPVRTYYASTTRYQSELLEVVESAKLQRFPQPKTVPWQLPNSILEHRYDRDYVCEVVTGSLAGRLQILFKTALRFRYLLTRSDLEWLSRLLTRSLLGCKIERFGCRVKSFELAYRVKTVVPLLRYYWGRE